MLKKSKKICKKRGNRKVLSNILYIIIYLGYKYTVSQKEDKGGNTVEEGYSCVRERVCATEELLLSPYATRSTRTQGQSGWNNFSGRADKHAVGAFEDSFIPETFSVGGVR